jgi:hypothetical protein
MPRRREAKQIFFNDLCQFLRALRDVRRNITVGFLYKRWIRARRLNVYRTLKH